jgi:DNA-binding NarL/FixJ family response regulator
MTDRWIAERKAAAKQQELSTALAQLQAMAESIRESASKFATPWPESRPESLSTSGVSTKQDRQIGERLSLLSRRELQIMEGLLRGERNADMAIRLNLSRKSISTYRSRVLEKLRVANNAQLVAAVHAHRITGHTK